MDAHALLSAAQWAVGKALASVADGELEAWVACNNLGIKIEPLRMELLLVQTTLELAGGKQIGGPAMEELLRKLRDSAHSADDLLDYFRIHEQLHGTDEHDILTARHTFAKAIGKLACLPACCSASAANPAGEPGQVQDESKHVSGCVPMLGKLLPCSSSQHGHDDNSSQSTLCAAPQREHAMLRFDRVDVSVRMKHIVEQLLPVHTEVTTILQSCDRITFPDMTQSRPTSTAQIIEPQLYGRDDIMNSIIRDMTNGQYCDKPLTVLPVVGLGGVGKTTMIQHIYRNQQVLNHFEVRVWICVSLDFSLNKLLQEIKESIPKVEGEKAGTTGELIKQRLKYRRFLLVLDDIWKISDGDDWERLLSTLNESEAKGCMVLVTTRFQAIAQMVKTTKHPIQLEGLETEVFRKLFFAFVFGDEQCQRDHNYLLEIEDKIMEKLKGSPLAAKTVGRLLRQQLTLHHWKSVLESKQWERQTNTYDIMPALKLSYDHLPFHLQQCFFYSALFPEDFHFSSSQLICLWIGLDIIQPGARYQTLQDIGLSNLNDLVMHGFFKEEETNGRLCYVIHDLLHDLALKVASHECLTLHRSNVGSLVIHPSIRHLSIIIDDDTGVSCENFRTELRKLKKGLKVEHLQTLMLFGEMDESLANIFGDLFREANALRVLHLPGMAYPVESMLHNFSTLVHLRYLFLGTKDRGLMHRFLCPGTEFASQLRLPAAISRFYHLRILDLGSWYGCCDFPKDISNLAKLCHFYTSSDELHSDIVNVGRLKLLEELKVFKVNKESEGYEPKQLEHLTKLRELGIYNLENIHTEEEATEAKLIEKKDLSKLTLDWDSKRSNIEPGVEAVILESLKPHRYLQELYIRGHGGPSCPTWMGDELAVEALSSLHLSGVSWEYLPSVGKMWDLRKLVLKHIDTVKQFVIELSFCRLVWFELVGLESFEKWVPTQNAHHMFPLLQVLIIRDCPKLSELPFSNHIVYPPDQHRNIDWFPRLQELEIEKCPELLPLPPIPWTETLRSVSIRGVVLLEKLVYSYSSHGGRLDIVGKGDLRSLGQVLAFNNLTGLVKLSLVKCPPLKLKHLLMLTSLKTLIAESSGALTESLGGQGDVGWQLPVEHIEVQESCGSSGKGLTELITHLPRLSELEITECGKITHLSVGVDLQQTTSAASEGEKDEMPAGAERDKEEDGVLLFPAHLSNTLRELVISHCPDLVLVAPPTLLPDGGGLLALRCLQSLILKETPKFLSAYLFSSPSRCLFPSSLQFLELNGVEGMGTVEPLSNLTSLTLLELRNCGEDLRCKGLESLLTAGGQLSTLIIYGSPRFFVGWNPNPRRVLQDEGGEQQLQPSSSSKLQKLCTDDVAGLLAMPICSLLSSSLTQLQLSGTKEMERFSNEQEDALHLLTSLRKLEFFGFDKLRHLPTGLHKLTRLMELQISSCPSVSSLPNDGLPNLLQKLDVWDCGNEELTHQCKGSMGILPKIRLEF